MKRGDLALAARALSLPTCTPLLDDVDFMQGVFVLGAVCRCASNDTTALVGDFGRVDGYWYHKR